MLGPAFYLVTALVPALLVTHLLLFGLLLRRQAATEPNHSQRLEPVELPSRAVR
jgi:hypothetical protein